jgi:hypothetical protein
MFNAVIISSVQAHTGRRHFPSPIDWLTEQFRRRLSSELKAGRHKAHTHCNAYPTTLHLLTSVARRSYTMGETSHLTPVMFLAHLNGQNAISRARQTSPLFLSPPCIWYKEATLPRGIFFAILTPSIIISSLVTNKLALIIKMLSYLALAAIVPAFAVAQVGGCGGVQDPAAYCTSLMGPGYTCSSISCVTASPTAPLVGGCGGVQDPEAYCTSLMGPGYTCSGVSCVTTTAPPLVGGCGGVQDPAAYCTSLMGPGYTCSGVSCVTSTTTAPPIIGGCGGVQYPDAFCTSQFGPGYTCSGVSCVIATTTAPPIVGGCGGVQYPDALCTSQFGPGYTCSGVSCIVASTTSSIPIVGGCGGVQYPDAFCSSQFGAGYTCLGVSCVKAAPTSTTTKQTCTACASTTTSKAKSTNTITPTSTLPVNSLADRVHLDMRSIVGVGAGAVVAVLAVML